MIDLRPCDITWHPVAGQPVVIYGDRGGTLRLPIGIGAEDARLLVAASEADSSPRQRLFRLLGETLGTLGGRLVEVTLTFRCAEVLEARLRLDGPRGPVALTAPAVDGLILARRAGLPVRVATADLARLHAWATRPDPSAAVWAGNEVSYADQPVAEPTPPTSAEEEER
jgi:bifunctional DNase/RNase